MDLRIEWSVGSALAVHPPETVAHDVRHLEGVLTLREAASRLTETTGVPVEVSLEVPRGSLDYWIARRFAR